VPRIDADNNDTAGDDAGPVDTTGNV
jgi:hypothetical protein